MIRKPWFLRLRNWWNYNVDCWLVRQRSDYPRSAFGLSWLHHLIYNAAYPTYECELCVGQEGWQGCYCAYHGAISPSAGPHTGHLLLRLIWDRVSKDTGDYETWWKRL